jgi:uncharacterized protein (DUF342 family)
MDMNEAYYNLFNKEDGLYIRIFPGNDDETIKLNDITSTLDNNKILDYDKELIANQLTMLKEEKEFKISNVIAESIDEVMNINVSNDKLSVYIRFSPAVGQGKIITSSEIIKGLKNNNIIYGIDEDKIKQIVIDKKYNKNIEVVKGLKPIKGKDGKIEYLFETNKKIKPKMNKNGSVDYHKLNLINNVKKGDILARLIPEEEGIPGKNVYGEEINTSKGKAKKLYFGKNTVVRDGVLFALSDGQVKIDNGKIIVLDYLEISGNIDNSTGDIDFLGTVLVRGNVLTGYSIKAKGDVEVSGAVEGAHIVSEGNIILHSGIQGMDRGVIEAKGNVIAKYIENSKVISGGSIHSDAILHSDISCKEEIIVDGKKGLISGGTIRSGIEVSAKVIGSHMGTVTIIDVGIDPTFMDEYIQIQQDIKKLTDEENKLTQIINLLNKRKQIEGSLDEKKKQMLINATRGKIMISSKLNNSNKRYIEMMEKLDNKNKGRIKVLGSVYPGVRVSIGSVKYYVRNEIKSCIMIQDGADIKITNN